MVNLTIYARGVQAEPPRDGGGGLHGPSVHRRAAGDAPRKLAPWHGSTGEPCSAASSGTSLPCSLDSAPGSRGARARHRCLVGYPPYPEYPSHVRGLSRYGAMRSITVPARDGEACTTTEPPPMAVHTVNG